MKPSAVPKVVSLTKFSRKGETPCFAWVCRCEDCMMEATMCICPGTSREHNSMFAHNILFEYVVFSLLANGYAFVGVSLEEVEKSLSVSHSQHTTQSQPRFEHQILE